MSFVWSKVIGSGSGSEVVSHRARCARCADCKANAHWSELSRQDSDLLSKQGGESDPGCRALLRSSLQGLKLAEDQRRGCVIKRTYDPKYDKLIQLVRSLAQSRAETALPYLGFQILKLQKGARCIGATTTTLIIPIIPWTLEGSRVETWRRFVMEPLWWSMDFVCQDNGMVVLSWHRGGLGCCRGCRARRLLWLMGLHHRP